MGTETNMLTSIHKKVFACLFSVHNTVSLSHHDQVCIMRLRFERYLSSIHFLMNNFKNNKDCKLELILISIYSSVKQVYSEYLRSDICDGAVKIASQHLNNKLLGHFFS